MMDGTESWLFLVDLIKAEVGTILEVIGVVSLPAGFLTRQASAVMGGIDLVVVQIGVAPVVEFDVSTILSRNTIS